jgi:hypothetical protein
MEIKMKRIIAGMLIAGAILSGTPKAQAFEIDDKTKTAIIITIVSVVAFSFAILAAKDGYRQGYRAGYNKAILEKNFNEKL